MSHFLLYDQEYFQDFQNPILVCLGKVNFEDKR